MANIIGANKDTEDKKEKNKRSGKDCPDFDTFKDGTLTGDPKYCWWSFCCHQGDMQTDYYMFTGYAPFIEEGKMFLKYLENHFDYMCTGCLAKKEDICKDKEIS